MKTRYIILGAIILVVISFLIPEPLMIPIPSGYPTNETICLDCDAPRDAIPIILFTILLPIIAVVAIVIYWHKPKQKEENQNE